MPRPRSSATEPVTSDPRLTVGQRLLLRLPSLQRDRSGAAGATKAVAPVPTTPGAKAAPKTGAPKTATAKTVAAGTPKTGAPKTGTPTPKAGTAKAGTAKTAKTATPKVDTADAGTPATGDTAAAPAPLGARIRDSLLKPKPPPKRAANGKAPTKQDPYPDKTSAELKRWLKRLDDQERMLTLVAAPLAAVISIAGIFYRLGSNPAIGKTGYIAPTTIETLGGVGVLLAAAVLAGGITRRRSFAVFALFFAGFPISFTLGIFGVLPFWGLGFWLFQRSSKMQRSLTSRGDHPRQQRGRGGAARSSAGTATRGGGRRKKAPEPTGPAPNKRYTPPKPREDAER